MRIDIEFICTDCACANRDKKLWIDRETSEWYTLSDALEHQRLNPTHKIRATAEFEINL